MEQNKCAMIVNTSELADLFLVSERQVQRLVSAGVIEPIEPNARAYRFDLTEVVPQYCSFLESGIPMTQWAPDT